jgi:hypothetical protein
MTPRAGHAGDPRSTMTDDIDHTGTLVIRVWLEDGRTSGLRARITRTVGVRPRDEVVTTAASVDEISDDVRAWLDSFLTAEETQRDASGRPGS